MEQIYQYQNHIFHAVCVAETVEQSYYIKGSSHTPSTPEVYLDIVARFKGVNRNKPDSYSQDDFPKPYEVTDNTTCPHCLKLIEKEKDQ